MPEQTLSGSGPGLTCLLVFTVTCPGTSPAAASEDVERPNILLIMADDLGVCDPNWGQRRTPW